MRQPIPHLLLFALLLVAPAAAPGQVDGDPDPGFCNTGYCGYPHSSDDPVAVACGVDGTCYMAARTTVLDGDGDWQVRRVSRSGFLGANFFFGFDLGGALNDFPEAIAVQPDGKVIVVGAAQDSNTGGDNNRLAVARLRTTGPGIALELDPTFGSGGKVTVDFVGDAKGQGVAIDGSGRIVVVGRYFTGSGSNFDMVIVRLTAAGILDTTFDGNGIRTVAFDFGSSLRDELRAVTVQADGRIVAAGYVEFDSEDADFAVIRLNDNGSLDSSFSGDGKSTVAFDITNDIDFANSVQLDRFGRVVVGGQADGGGSAAVARFTSSGLLDGTFGSGGRVAHPIVGRATDFRLTSFPIERILFLRTGAFGGPSALTASGAPDPTFAGDGDAPFVYPGSSANDALAMTLAGGQPVVVGMYTFLGEEDLSFARYWTDLAFGDDFDGGTTSSWSRWPAW